MLSLADAAVVAAHVGDEWPDPTRHRLPSPLAARDSALKLIGSGVFGLALAAMIALLVRDTAPAYEGWRLWLRIAVAVAICAIGIALLVTGIRTALKPRLIVRLALDGLHAPDLYREVVPWSEVAVVLHDKPRVKIFGPGRILIGIRGGERFGRVASTDLRPAEAPGGIDAAQLPQLLDARIDRLLETLQGYRAHLGRGGATEAPG
jgi:hypothetical protein